MHPPSSLAPIAIREDGLGLINMRARARQLNGTFELNSELGRGTTVRVTIPFRPAMWLTTNRAPLCVRSARFDPRW